MAVSAGQVKAGEAAIDINGNDKNFLKSLENIRKKAGTLGSVFNKMRMDFEELGQAFLKATAVLTIPTIGGLKTFVELDDKLRAVGATAGMSKKEVSSFSDEVKRLAIKLGTMPDIIAEAAISLARGGFSGKEINDSLESVLNFSKATRTDLPQATLIALDMLRSFNLEAAQMPLLMDLMVRASNKASLNATELYQAFSYVVPAANQAGESIFDVAAAMMFLADNGVKGTRAGTALARVYKNLTKETQTDVMASLGLNAADAAGNFKPVLRILKEIGKATEDMGSKERLGIFEKLFGRGQVPAIILSQGMKVDEKKDLLGGYIGEAEKIRKIMEGGLGGAFRRISATFKVIFSEIGEELEKTFLTLSVKVEEALKEIRKFLKENKSLIHGLLNVSVKVLAVAAGFISFALVMKTVSMSIKLVSAALTVLHFSLFFALNSFTIMSATVLASIYAFKEFYAEGRALKTGLSNTFKEMASNISTSIGVIEKAIKEKDFTKAWRVALASMKFFAQTVWLDILAGTATFKAGFIQALLDLPQTIERVSTKGSTVTLSLFAKIGDAISGTLYFKELGRMWLNTAEFIEASIGSIGEFFRTVFYDEPRKMFYDLKLAFISLGRSIQEIFFEAFYKPLYKAEERIKNIGERAISLARTIIALGSGNIYAYKREQEKFNKIETREDVDKRLELELKVKEKTGFSDFNEMFSETQNKRDQISKDQLARDAEREREEIERKELYDRRRNAIQKYKLLESDKYKEIQDFLERRIKELEKTRVDVGLSEQLKKELEAIETLKKDAREKWQASLNEKTKEWQEKTVGGFWRKLWPGGLSKEKAAYSELPQNLTRAGETREQSFIDFFDFFGALKLDESRGATEKTAQEQLAVSKRIADSLDTAEAYD